MSKRKIDIINEELDETLRTLFEKDAKFNDESSEMGFLFGNYHKTMKDLKKPKRCVFSKCNRKGIKSSHAQCFF